MEEKKLAVIFPGVGYTCAKPLLYYAAQAAREAGYEVIRLNYGADIHNFPGRAPEELFPIVELAESRMENQLEKIGWDQYSDIVFISKSIGTTVAGYVEEVLELHARHFMMTPLPTALLSLDKMDGCFVVGTEDLMYTDPEILGQAMKQYPDKIGAVFEGCDHSLERKGDMEGNIQNVRKVMELLKSKLR